MKVIDVTTHTPSTCVISRGDRARIEATRWLTLVLCLSGIAWSRVGAQAPGQHLEAPPAQASDGYDQLLDRAVDAFEAADFARAHEYFERAFALRPNARVLRGLGIAGFRLAHYTEAKQRLTAALSDPNQPLTATQRDEVTKLLAWMQARLGTVHLQVQPQPERTWVDDVPAPGLELVVSPGVHRIRMLAAGFEAEERTVDISAGENQILILTLRARPVSPAHVAAAAPAPAPAPQVAMAPPRDTPAVWDRWWFWTAIGVGALAIGGAAAAIAVSKQPATKSVESGRVIVLLRAAP